MKKTFDILMVERLNNSYYGNPRFALVVRDMDSSYMRGKTASNAMIGYEFTMNMVGKTLTMEYHRTKAGSIIFDRIVEG